MDLRGEYSFVNMAYPRFENSQELNHALLDEFKIQEDVKMYSQRPGYYGFRGFDLSDGNGLTAISKRTFG